MDSLTYEATTGRLLNPDGTLLASCYSGLGKDKNNPGSEGIKNCGPLPEGGYTLTDVEDVNGGPHGPYVIRLTPDKDNEMHGRSGFLMHSDSISHPGAASEGCIVVLGGLSQRQKIWNQPVHHLTVVSGRTVQSLPSLHS